MSFVLSPDDLAAFVRAGGGPAPGGSGAPAGVDAATLAAYCVATAEREVAITFDDGPHGEHTPAILDSLAARGLRASFYVLAAQAQAHPDIVRRIVADGHELGLHGDVHDSLLTMDAATARSRIAAARETVEAIAGVPIAQYRPPYGAHRFEHAGVVRELGLEFVVWSGDAADWVDDAEQAVAERGIAQLFCGAILLLHDNRGDPETLQPGEKLPAFDKAAVLGRILDEAARRGLRPVTVGELLARHPIVRSYHRAAVAA